MEVQLRISQDCKVPLELLQCGRIFEAREGGLMESWAGQIEFTKMMTILQN